MKKSFKATYFKNLCHSKQNLHVLHKISVYIVMLYCMSDELFEENLFQQFLPRNYLLTINA